MWARETPREAVARTVALTRRAFHHAISSFFFCMLNLSTDHERMHIDRDHMLLLCSQAAEAQGCERAPPADP
jgi:hypothetical protein